MPLIQLSPVATVVVDVCAWIAIHTSTGYAVHRTPVERLQHDGWLLRIRPAEADGRVYQRVGIRRWKDRLPEAGDFFAGGMSKRHLPAEADGGLTRFAVETRRAELGHWSAMAGGPLFVLWNPPLVALIMVGYGIAANAPFIAIQRYNRLRVDRVLARRGAGERSGDGA
jgi:glycosyl-4,4'-diaponeurosporenoate acyltransferase